MPGVDFPLNHVKVNRVTTLDLWIKDARNDFVDYDQKQRDEKKRDKILKP